MNYEIIDDTQQVAERTDEGFILLARGILKSPTWKALTPEQKVVMITCLLKANHKDEQWWDNIKKEFIPVKRGQFITSLDKLRQCCGKGITIKKLRTALEVLENMRFLAKQGAKNYTLVTIANYDLYQTISNYGAKQRANEGHTEGTPRATNNNDKNDKHVKKKDIYSPDFEQFWNVYPRRIEKQEAFKNWNTRLKEKYTPEEMIAAARNYATYCQKNRIDKKYIKHPSTFLGPNKPFTEFIKGVEPDGEYTGSDYEDLIIR